MADITTIATVTRAELELAPLDINDGVNYVLGQGVNTTSVTWRKEAVQSPFVHGRVPVHEVKDAMESDVTIYVHGATPALVDTNLSTVISAFTDQFVYTLQISADGVDHQWDCERADYDVAFRTPMLAARIVPVRFSFFRHPIPVAGSF